MAMNMVQVDAVDLQEQPDIPSFLQPTVKDVVPEITAVGLIQHNRKQYADLLFTRNKKLSHYSSISISIS